MTVELTKEQADLLEALKLDSKNRSLRNPKTFPVEKELEIIQCIKDEVSSSQIIKDKHVSLKKIRDIKAKYGMVGA